MMSDSIRIGRREAMVIASTAGLGTVTFAALGETSKGSSWGTVQIDPTRVTLKKVGEERRLGLQGSDEYVVLNEAGVLVWELLTKKEQNIPEAVGVIAERALIPRDVAAYFVLSFVSLLSQAGIVVSYELPLDATKAFVPLVHIPPGLLDKVETRTRLGSPNRNAPSEMKLRVLNDAPEYDTLKQVRFRFDKSPREIFAFCGTSSHIGTKNGDTDRVDDDPAE